MEFSIVIPCRNEGANVETMVRRIVAALGSKEAYEIWFVDDSSDDTPDILARLSREYRQVRYVHRKKGTGLSSAVLEGFRRASGDWYIVMDADLQHPPEVLPDVIREIRRDAADIVIPSRFLPGASDGGLNLWRKSVSWTARMMARALLGKVRRITDPTSGFFAVRRKVLDGVRLEPIGWKILLELLVRCRHAAVIELPYRFQARDLGQSKFNLKQQWLYTMHLVRLVRSSEEDLKFWKFCLVGLSGIIVNMLVYIPLLNMGMHIGLAYTLATVTAILNNFAWNNLFTWTHLKHDRLWQRMLKFFAVSLSGLALSGAAVVACNQWLGLHKILSGLIGIGFSVAWNFLLNNRWTFARKGGRSR